jgi:glycosyltransferase involved in cell wall biosynthesis
MRVCFYNVTATYLKGGLETYCWEAGRAMARRGHEVSIVAGNRGDARHGEVRLVQFPFRAEKEWPDLGVRFRRLAERLSFARHALAHLLESGYDAVVVNKPFDFPVLWQARRKGFKGRVLFRSGGTDFFPGDRLFAGAITDWVSASRYNARQVAARYGREVTTIHNGVDTEVFRPQGRVGSVRAGYGVGEAEILLVSVGRLVGWKGISVIVQALAQLPAGIHYLIVGDGPERDALESLAKRLGLVGRVRFAGAVAHRDLPILLSNCDLFVQPSKGEEAFGISVVEAMACGLAVFASDNGGLPEIVLDGETGRLLPPGDVSAWAESIAAVVAEPATLKRWAVAARSRAESEFTWAANAAKLEMKLSGERA